MTKWSFSLAKELLGFMKWFYRNSILTEESYSSILLKKWKIPLRQILVIPLWLIEWLASCIIIGFYGMAAYASVFLILVVLGTVIGIISVPFVAIANNEPEAFVSLLILPWIPLVFYGVLKIFEWFSRKVMSLGKLRRKG